VEKKVKYRLLTYYVDGQDMLTGASVKHAKTATFGDVLTSAEGLDGDPAGWRYNVPEQEFMRLEQVHGSPFFSDAEFAAAESTGNLGEVWAGGEFRTAGTVTPLSFGAMSAWQVEEWIRSAQPTADEMVDIVEAEPAEGREAMARKLLTAESVAAGGEPRPEVVELLASVLGAAAVEGPLGPEGIEGTEPEAPPSLTSGGSGGSAESDEDATEGAIELAAAEGVSLSEVEGTGEGGRITKPDVQRFLDEK